MFQPAIQTAMRMRELYSLTVDQINCDQLQVRRERQQIEVTSYPS